MRELVGEVLIERVRRPRNFGEYEATLTELAARLNEIMGQLDEEEREEAGDLLVNIDKVRKGLDADRGGLRIALGMTFWFEDWLKLCAKARESCIEAC